MQRERRRDEGLATLAVVSNSYSCVGGRSVGGRASLCCPHFPSSSHPSHPDLQKAEIPIRCNVGILEGDLEWKQAMWGEMAMNATRPRRLQIRQNTESAFGVAVQRLQTKHLPWGEITSMLQQGGMDGWVGKHYVYALAPRHDIMDVTFCMFEQNHGLKTRILR